MKILSLLILTFVFGCQHSEQTPFAPAPKQEKAVITPDAPVKTGIKNCTCIQMFMPVCGDNGKTYSNSCFANCAGVSFKQGACKEVITE